MTEKEREALEREEKKEYLKGVYYAKIAIARLEEEKEALRSSKLIPTLPMDDMPHGSSNLSDLSGYAADLDELERKILQERYRAIRAYKAIREEIERMPDEQERSVLTYRYLLNWKWEKICEKMNYRESQIKRIHNKAITNFEWK